LAAARQDVNHGIAAGAVPPPRALVRGPLPAGSPPVPPTPFYSALVLELWSSDIAALLPLFAARNSHGVTVDALARQAARFAPNPHAIVIPPFVPPSALPLIRGTAAHTAALAAGRGAAAADAAATAAAAAAVAELLAGESAAGGDGTGGSASASAAHGGGGAAAEDATGITAEAP
jgi:hypothetical protein